MTKPARRSLRILALVIAWFIVWFLSNPILTAAFLLDRVPDVDTRFAVMTGWMVAVGTVATIIWALCGGSFRALRLPRRRRLIAYLAGISLMAAFSLRILHFGVSSWIYVPSMLLSAFWQDLLTFGFLQTGLATQTTAFKAAVITAAVFLAGHLFDPMIFSGGWSSVGIICLYGLGFGVFAFLRKRTGTIYATNFLHAAFLLLT